MTVGAAVSPPRVRVAFAGVFAGSLAPEVEKHLTVPCEVILAAETAIAARLGEVDVLVTLAFTAEMGRAAERLKLVQVPGAGLDRIDRAALPPTTWLANAYGHDTGIAEHVLGAMLALTREFLRLDAALRRGVWESQWGVGVSPPPAWAELAGKTVAILGYGRIGQAVAHRARAFGMEICAIRRDVARSATAPLALLGGLEILETVLARADYLVITLPLSAETRGLIGERELRAMKPSAYVINVARAEIVDEDALYTALAERRIAGAALDVWYRYPTSPGASAPARRAFHELPNVLMTPHVAGWTEGMLVARAKVIAENIGRAARDQPPVNLVPPAV